MILSKIIKLLCIASFKKESDSLPSKIKFGVISILWFHKIIYLINSQLGIGQ